MRQSNETMERLLFIGVDPYKTTTGDTTVRSYLGGRWCCDTPAGFKLLTDKQVIRLFGTYM